MELFCKKINKNVDTSTEMVLPLRCQNKKLRRWNNAGKINIVERTKQNDK